MSGWPNQSQTWIAVCQSHSPIVELSYQLIQSAHEWSRLVGVVKVAMETINHIQNDEMRVHVHAHTHTHTHTHSTEQYDHTP